MDKLGSKLEVPAPGSKFYAVINIYLILAYLNKVWGFKHRLHILHFSNIGKYWLYFGNFFNRPA